MMIAKTVNDRKGFPRHGGKREKGNERKDSIERGESDRSRAPIKAEGERIAHARYALHAYDRGGVRVVAGS